jgi:transposase
MVDFTLFVGLDVHKKTVAVAMVEASASGAVRFYGTIANTPDAVRTLCKKLSRDGQQLHFCYEDGVIPARRTGFAKLGRSCGATVHRRINRRTRHVLHRHRRFD